MTLIEHNLEEVELGRLVALYLVYSYLYYERGESVVSDQTYDDIAKMLYDRWDDVEHPDKGRIDRSALKTSGFYLEYTNQIKYAAEQLLTKQKNKVVITKRKRK